jgi:iron complex outermembrane recepter protein
MVAHVPSPSHSLTTVKPQPSNLAYHSDVENSLVPFEVEGEAGVTYFRNAGSATHRGFEVGAALTPLDGLSIRSAYSLTSAKFDEYTVGNLSYSGNKVPGVAPNRLETVVTVSPRGFPWYIAAENRHVARTAANDANTAFSPSYTITEIRGGLDAIEIGRTSLDLFAGTSNILDREYNTSLAVNAAGQRFFESGPGRSFYLGGNVRLNSR